MRYTEYTKITSLQKIEHTYCWRGDGKGGEQGTSEDTTEEWQGQGIDNNEVLHTDAIEGYEMKDRSDLDVYFQTRQKAWNTS